MRKNKKGVSAVVATVLIVMITVAAVGLLWAIVAPFLKTNVQDKTACVDASVSLEVDKDSKFTCTGDPSSVRIARGSDTVDIIGIDIKYGTGDGDTATQRNETTYLVPNTEKVYNISSAITEVAVAAIIASDGDNVTCDATPTVIVTRACT